MLCREKSEILRLASEMNNAVDKLIEMEKNGAKTPKKQAISAVIKFNKQEIAKMDKTFKREFIANGLSAHVIKKESGRNSYCYEIRYRSNGYNIIASSTDLAEAKRKFLAKTVPGEIEKYRVQKRKTGINLLEEVFDEWYQYKQGTITEKELKRSMRPSSAKK